MPGTTAGAGTVLSTPPALTTIPPINQIGIFDGLSPPNTPGPTNLIDSNKGSVNPAVQLGITSTTNGVSSNGIEQLSPYSPGNGSNNPVRLPDVSIRSTGRVSSNPSMHNPLNTGAVTTSVMAGQQMPYNMVNNINTNGLSQGLNFSPVTGAPESSVENQLATHGYITRGRIITKGPSGEIEGRYLKTINNRGQTVYIDPSDVDGWIGYESSDVIMYETDKPSKIPVSFRNGSLESAGMDVSGVAFECEGEICTVMRDSAMNPVETVLHSLNNNLDKTIIEDGSVIAYPVVRMGDILANDQRVSHNVDMAVARIRNVAYKFCHENMKQMLAQTEQLLAKHKELNQSVNQGFSDLGSSIRTLEGYRNAYDQNPPSNDEGKANSRKIAFNLGRRHDMMVDLLKICSSVSEYGDQLKDINSRFDEFQQHVSNVYSGVGSEAYSE